MRPELSALTEERVKVTEEKREWVKSEQAAWRCVQLEQAKNTRLLAEVNHWRMIAENGGVRGSAETLRVENTRLRTALELIATPKRADGTYSRSREACEELARKALSS